MWRYNDVSRYAERRTHTRRAFAIHAYVGSNGGGKSLAMVNDTLDTLAGIKWECTNPEHHHAETVGWRRVASTVPLRLADGRPHPLWVPLNDYRVLVTLEHCDVLLDEVTGVASARESQGMPPQVANYLVQLRRRDVLLRWTSPNWLRADRIIRECTQAVTTCAGYLPAKVEGEARLWRPRRFFLWRTYDADGFDEFSTHKRETLRPVAKQWYHRESGSAMDAYDTLGAVETLGWPNEAGLCMECGGSRARPRCSCTPARSKTPADHRTTDDRPQDAERPRTDGRRPLMPEASPVQPIKTLRPAVDLGYYVHPPRVGTVPADQ